MGELKFTNNFNITRLFSDKRVRVSIKGEGSFIIIARTLRDIYVDDNWNIFYNFWSTSIEELIKQLGLKEVITKFSLLKLVLFKLGAYDTYNSIYSVFMEQLPKLLPEIEINKQEIKINSITMTEDIWEYVLYVVKLIYGEIVKQPLTFSSEEAYKLFLAQQEHERKIRALRAKDGGADNTMKLLLGIVYSFPSFTIDYLLDQTMAQILWLQKYAAGAVGYEVNAKAYAAGNMKKGKTPEFFIK